MKEKKLSIFKKFAVEKDISRRKRKALKLAKNQMLNDKYLISGEYTDKLSKTKNLYLFGSISQNQYNQKYEELVSLQKEKHSALQDNYLKQKEAILNQKISYDEYGSDFFDKHNFVYSSKKGIKRIAKAIKNPTFLYILRRVVMSLITLTLIVSFIILLISLIPDTSFYNSREYDLIKAKAGKQVADNYVASQLYKYGRVNSSGVRISVIEQIFTYLYWILPIPKTIHTAFDPSNNYAPIPMHDIHPLVYLGGSIDNGGKAVTSLVADRIGISFRISMIVLFLNYLIAYPLGIAMSKKPGGLVDKLGNIFIVINYSIPALVFYLFVNAIFGKGVGGFSFGFAYDEARPIVTLIPPIFAIVFLSIPGVAVWVRRFMVDELSSDYVKFAKAKGLSANQIMYKHVLRNAIVPLVRNIPASFIFAIVGSYFVEYIWAIPGTGSLLIRALRPNNPDIMVILGLTTIYSSLGMLSFLLGDIATVFADPRIKLSKE